MGALAARACSVCTCARSAYPHACSCFVCPPADAATFLGLWSASAARLGAAGPEGGNLFAEGLNYFAPRETGPRPHSAVDLGGKGPNASWGSRAQPELGSERRWRRRAPEIYFQGRGPSSCSGRSWLKRVHCRCLVRGRGKHARESGSSETLPSQRRLRPAGFSKHADFWQ